MSYESQDYNDFCRECGGSGAIKVTAPPLPETWLCSFDCIANAKERLFPSPKKNPITKLYVMDLTIECRLEVEASSVDEAEDLAWDRFTAENWDRDDVSFFVADELNI